MARLDNSDRLSKLDGQVIGQVTQFKTSVVRHAAALRHEHALVRQLARPARGRAARRWLRSWRSGSGCSRRSRSEIATLEAQERARQQRALLAAQARIAAAQQAQVQRRRRRSSARPRPRRRARPGPVVALRRQRRVDRDVVHRRAVRLGRRVAGRVRLLRARHVRLRAARRLAPPLLVCAVQLRHAGLVQRPAAGRPRLLRRRSATSGCTSGAASSSTRPTPARTCASTA